MDGNSEELTLRIGEARRHNKQVFYIEVIRHAADSSKSYIGKYLKKDGKIELWTDERDYMFSHQECLDAIAINYDILREVEGL